MERSGRTLVGVMKVPGVKLPWGRAGLTGAPLVDQESSG